jgi:hypothetical protein
LLLALALQKTVAMVRTLLVLSMLLVNVPSCSADEDLGCEAKTPEPGKGCYEIDEPEWNPRGPAQVTTRQMRNVPPVGSVRPPPDCSVCSPRSAPSPVASETSPELPYYLMSNACLIAALRTPRELP